MQPHRLTQPPPFCTRGTKLKGLSISVIVLRTNVRFFWFNNSKWASSLQMMYAQSLGNQWIWLTGKFQSLSLVWRVSIRFAFRSVAVVPSLQQPTTDRRMLSTSCHSIKSTQMKVLGCFSCGPACTFVIIVDRRAQLTSVFRPCPGALPKGWPLLNLLGDVSHTALRDADFPRDFSLILVVF